VTNFSLWSSTPPKHVPAESLVGSTADIWWVLVQVQVPVAHLP
jgi:hypothetical protein